MPILDHIGARRQVRINIEPKLPIVRRELLFRVPTDGLRIGFSCKVIRPPGPSVIVSPTSLGSNPASRKHNSSAGHGQLFLRKEWQPNVLNALRRIHHDIHGPVGVQ